MKTYADFLEEAKKENPFAKKDKKDDEDGRAGRDGDGDGDMDEEKDDKKKEKDNDKYEVNEGTELPGSATTFHTAQAQRLIQNLNTLGITKGLNLTMINTDRLVFVEVYKSGKLLGTL